jgi:lipopolysaccharide transport system permease protein
MVGVIEGFRWALLGKEQPDVGVMAVSATVVLLLFVGGMVYFKWMERTFADVV